MSLTTPRSVHEAFLERFNAGDLDGLVDLYEDGATIVSADGATRSGKDAIREALGGFVAAGGTMTMETRYVAESGDTALLGGEWHLGGTGANGEPLDVRAKSNEVVRRQPDGRWLVILDHPWGGE